MIKTIYTISIFTLLILSGAEAVAQGTLGLIARWPMTGNAMDVSSNGLHGVMFGTAPDTGRDGKPGTALRFNGTSFIDVPYSTHLNTDSLTICATVKQTGFNHAVCQINQILMRGTYRTTGSYGLLSSDHPFDQDCINVDSSETVFCGTISTNINPVTDSMWHYTPAIVADKWYSIVMTYDGSEAKVYVDGVHQATAIVNVALGTSIEGLYIGMNYFGDTSAFPYPFTGVIDDIALYRRVLDSSQILAYHHSTALDVPGKEMAGAGLSLAPNPVKDVLRLRLGRAIPGGRISISNSLGQVVLQQVAEGAEMLVPVSGWSSGHYFLQWTAGDHVQHERFIVE